MSDNVDNRVIISLHDVSMSWEHRKVLSDVTFDVHRGDFIAITGPNGGGKTTLLRIILRLLHPTTGSVEYYNEGNRTDRLSIGYLPQKNMIDARFPITVGEVVEMGLIDRRGLSKPEIRDKVTQMLELTGLQNMAHTSLGNLSGGQMQRALLGRALIMHPQVLVLDEPLSYVDKHFEHRIYDIIERVAPTTTILLVSHEMSVIAAMANRHLVVDHTVEFCHSGSHLVHYDCCGDHECDCTSSMSSLGRLAGTSHALHSHSK